ncbi:MAG: hypothetical protein H7332_13875 [Bdellovibrionales bacterium]|nr:hypothetical protein [Ramlibacter sp.]
MDVNTLAQAGEVLVQIDLSQFMLPLLAANQQELDDHENCLLDLDKATKGKTVWRTAVL